VEKIKNSEEKVNKQMENRTVNILTEKSIEKACRTQKAPNDIINCRVIPQEDG